MVKLQRSLSRVLDIVEPYFGYMLSESEEFRHGVPLKVDDPNLHKIMWMCMVPCRFHDDEYHTQELF